MRPFILLFLFTSLAHANFSFGPPVSTVSPGRLLEDIDNDGDLDVIRFSYFAASGWAVTWTANDGSGLFLGASMTIGNIGDGTEALGNIEKADLNGDGLLDIVRWEINVPRIEAFFRDTTSATGYGPLTTLMSNPDFDDSKPKSPEFIEFPDLDGDGITDMVVGTGSKIWTMHGTGSGAFAAPVRVMDAFHQGLVVDDSTTPAKIYFGTSGGFDGILGLVADVDLMDIVLTGFEVAPAAMELYDVDGDGLRDLIVGSEGGWYAGLPGGDPWESTKRPFMSGRPVGDVRLQLRDIDLDGDKDLFLTGQVSSSTMSLVREDGGSDWTTTLTLDWDASDDMGDIDGNGKLDVIAGDQRYPFDPDIFVGFVDLAFGFGPHFTLTEGGGSQPLAIELSLPLDTDVTLSFTVAPDPSAGDPAVEGMDYAHGGDVVIPAGATTANFLVTPTDNTTLGVSRHFTATIASTDSTDVTISPASTTVTIADDEYFTVQASPAFANEASGNAHVDWVVDTNVIPAPGFTLSWQTMALGYSFPPFGETGPYDAWEGHDYTASAGSIPIAAGVLSGSISIPLLDDSLSEFDEMFGIEIQFGGGSNALFTTITIEDDEPDPSGFALAVLLEGYGGPRVEPTADPDGDRLSNLLEYALGTFDSDPMAAERAEPDWVRPPSGGGPGLGTCMRNPAPADVIVTIEHSADMGETIPWVAIARRVGDGDWVILDDSVTLTTEVLSLDTNCYFFRSADWSSDEAGFLQMDVELVP